MNTNHLALIAHLLGMAFWIGGMVTAATVASVSKDDEKGLGAARKAIFQWATPGMLLAWGGGLTMLIPNFTSTYASAGWMHAKLTIVVVLSGLTGVMTARVRKAAAGTKPLNGRLVDGLAWALTVGAMIVLALAVLKPF
ncbi:MAG: CopD family protein [Sandaracinaceae bacterium]